MFACNCILLIKSGISHPNVYVNVLNKAVKFKHKSFGHVCYLNKLMHTGDLYYIFEDLLSSLVSTFPVSSKIYLKTNRNKFFVSFLYSYNILFSLVINNILH